jgi:hypothetical protein
MLGTHSRDCHRTWLLRSVFALFLAALPLVASAQGLFGPPGNTDLKQVQSGIDKITSTVQKCRDMQCPAMNCASANELVQSMITTEMALDDMLKWLLDAASMQRQDHSCKAGDRDLTDIRLKEEFRILALQGALHNFGSLMFDLASFMDGVKNAFDPKRYPNRGIQDLAAWYDNAANIVNNLDSITDQVVNLLSGTSSDSEARKSIKEWTAVKSETVDGCREIKRLHQDLLNMDSRKPVDFTAHINSLGKIIGRILKAYSNDMIKETKDWINELARGALAEDQALTNSYQETQRIFDRFYAGKDVLANLRSARKYMIDCMVNAKCSISVFKFYPGSNNDWGTALRDINNRLPALTKSLGINIGLTKGKCPKDGDKPRNKISNDCPPCQLLADEVGRKTDEQRYFENESDRITIIKEKQVYALKEQLAVEEGKLARARKDIDRIYQKIYKNDQRFADDWKTIFSGSLSFKTTPAFILLAEYKIYDMLCSTKLDSELRQDLSSFTRDSWPPLIRANTLKAQIERLEAENDAVGEIKLRLVGLSGTIRDKRIALAKCADDKCPKKTACAACQPKADELKRAGDELRDKELSVKELEAKSRDNADARKQADSLKMGNSMLALKKKQLEDELSSCEKEQCSGELIPGTTCAPLKKVSTRKEIEQVLNGYIQSIDKMQAEVNKTYGYSTGQATLRAAMQNAGIRRFLDHSVSWAGWMWTFCQHMDEKFYQGHKKVLGDALQKVRTGKAPSQQRLQEIHSGMCQFEAVHRQVLTLMKKYVQKDVKRGLAYEEYQRFLDDYYYKVKDSPERDVRNKAALQKRETTLKEVSAEMAGLETGQKRIAGTKLF